MKPRTKELILIGLASVAINLGLFALYAFYVAPVIREASEGIAKMLLGQ